MNNKNNKEKIAIFASYNGSNIIPIYEAIKNNKLDISIEIIITNNSDANVIQLANKLNIPYKVVNGRLYKNIDLYINKLLKQLKCKYIVLSGYMKKLSPLLTNNFTIINSHPSLLPKYGGTGMYGSYVHQAVIKNKEKTSGVTFHYVNEHYDEGKIILQKKLILNEDETAQSLEKKIKSLEQQNVVKALKLCLK